MSNQKDFFLSVTERIFSNWTALKMAVEHGMGSKEHAQGFGPYITEVFFMNENLTPSEVAYELEDYMDTTFNTELEDDSAVHVAEELVRFYRLCVSESENKLAELEKLPPLQSWLRTTEISTNSGQQSRQNDSSSESDETLNDQMEIEDEWTTVKTRRKR